MDIIILLGQKINIKITLVSKIKKEEKGKNLHSKNLNYIKY